MNAESVISCTSRRIVRLKFEPLEKGGRIDQPGAGYPNLTIRDCRGLNVPELSIGSECRGIGAAKAGCPSQFGYVTK
jgi:hypothetical protein